MEGYINDLWLIEMRCSDRDTIEYAKEVTKLCLDTSTGKIQPALNELITEIKSLDPQVMQDTLLRLFIGMSYYRNLFQISALGAVRKALKPEIASIGYDELSTKVKRYCTQQHPRDSILIELSTLGSSNAFKILFQNMSSLKKNLSRLLEKIPGSECTQRFIQLSTGCTVTHLIYLKRLLEESPILFDFELFNMWYLKDGAVDEKDTDEIVQLIQMHPEILQHLRALPTLPLQLLKIVYPYIDEPDTQDRLLDMHLNHNCLNALTHLKSAPEMLSQQTLIRLQVQLVEFRPHLVTIAKHNDIALTLLLQNPITHSEYKFIFDDTLDPIQQERLAAFAGQLISANKYLGLLPELANHLEKNQFTRHFDFNNDNDMMLVTLATVTQRTNTTALTHFFERPQAAILACNRTRTDTLTNIREVLSNYKARVRLVTSSNLKRAINIMNVRPTGSVAMDRTLLALCDIDWKTHNDTPSHQAQMNIAAQLQTYLARYRFEHLETILQSPALTEESYRAIFSIGEATTQRQTIKHAIIHLLSKPLTEEQLTKLHIIAKACDNKLPYVDLLSSATSCPKDTLLFTMMPIDLCEQLLPRKDLRTVCKQKIRERTIDSHQAARLLAQHYLKKNTHYASTLVNMHENTASPSLEEKDSLKKDIIKTKQEHILSTCCLFSNSEAQTKSISTKALLRFHVYNCGIGERELSFVGIPEKVNIYGYIPHFSRTLLYSQFGEFIRNLDCSLPQWRQLCSIEQELQRDHQQQSIRRKRNILTELQHGKVFTQNSGWTGHVITLSFFQINGQTYLAFANRGERSPHFEPGITIFKVTRTEKLNDRNFINRLQENDMSRQYLEKVEPSQPDSLGQDFGLEKITVIKKTVQNHGNCVLACVTHAILIQLIAKSMTASNTEVTAETFQQHYQKVKPLYKQFKHFSRKQSIEFCTSLDNPDLTYRLSEHAHANLLNDIVNYVRYKSNDSLASTPHGKAELLEPIIQWARSATDLRKHCVLKNAQEALRVKGLSKFVPCTISRTPI
ncbi:MAG: hypothetical protein P1U34_05200 [Coxiellaceae bacterium]|nr:hypothetical protein [Coxiellaceae bacterium]